MSDIREWLNNSGLGEYAENFEREKVELGDLTDLTDADLAGLGLPLGPRKRLLRAIAERPDEPATEAPRPLRDAERRQLTVMFCDLVGSTELSHRLDPEDLRDVLRRYQDAVASAVTRYGGHVAKYLGDGVLAYFGWPQAYEDQAERAVRAGLDAVAAVSDVRLDDGGALTARVGIASGLVVIGDLVGDAGSDEEAVTGETPNLAARLQQSAAPGEVVIGSTIRRLIGRAFELERLRPQALKGFAKQVPTWRVLRQSAMESRFEAHQAGSPLPLIGRDQELALLLERWRQAKGNEGQMVLLSGEAGIGKSRLTRALIDAVAQERHVRIRYQCSPYHTDSALYPAIQQLCRAAGFTPNDAPQVKIDKLEALLALASNASDETAVLLAALLGLAGEARYGELALTPPQQRAQTLQALLAQLLGLARQQPVLFVLEDAHWIDPTTLDLVDLFIEQTATARVLLLVTARPTFEHGFGGHPIVTRLTLNRLGREQIAAIVDRLAGGKAWPEELLDEIVTKTDGIPLFVEELTKTILELGFLRETEEAYLLDGPLHSLTIPISLHDSLMARLDRLQPVKEVAQTAACIGREFGYPLLHAISPLADRELQDALERLIAAEIIFRRGLPPEATYIFKHALVRDAAYESLLKANRQQLHIRLVEALEQSADSAPEILAHHATKAGLTEKAIGYWQRAGERAAERSANVEAITHLKKGLSLLENLPDTDERARRELALQIVLGGPLIANKGYSARETAQTYTRARTLCERLSDTDRLLPALYGEWVSRYHHCDDSEARALAEKFSNLAQRQEGVGPRLVSARMMGLHLFLDGKFLEAQNHFKKLVELYDPAQHRSLAFQYGHDAKAAGLCYLSWTLWHLGYPDQAVKTSDAAIAWLKEINHANSKGLTLFFGAAVPQQFVGKVSEVEKHTQSLIAFSDEMKLPIWKTYGLVLSGWVQVSKGHCQAGLATIIQGLEAHKATGSERHMSYLLGIFADALLKCGETDQGLNMIAQALASTNRTAERGWEGDLHRIKGQLQLASTPADPRAAQASLNTALEIARHQSAKALELRAATSLAQLWYEQDKRERAHDLLAPVYNWFTEGFDTADLKKAKALLDKLMSAT